MNGMALPPSGEQRADHDRRRADSVDVVVAVNEDRLVLAQRAHESLDGAIEIGETVRLVRADRGAGAGTPSRRRARRSPRAASSRADRRAADAAPAAAARRPPASGSGGSSQRALGRARTAASGHDRKARIGRVHTNNHHSAAYNITPHPSQISVAPVPDMMLRRCSGSMRVAVAARTAAQRKHRVDALARANAVVAA